MRISGLRNLWAIGVRYAAKKIRHPQIRKSSDHVLKKNHSTRTVVFFEKKILERFAEADDDAVVSFTESVIDPDIGFGSIVELDP